MVKNRLKQEISRAIADYAKRVIAVLGWSHTGPEFSGVCVRVQGVHFLVTATHCLEGRDPADLHIATMKESHAAVPLRPIHRRCFHSKQIDMAVLQMSPEVASSLPVDWVDEYRLTSRAVKASELVCVAGFPSKIIEWGPRSGAVQSLYPIALILVSKVARWPRQVDTLNPPPDPDVDFFVDFESRSFLDEFGRDLPIPESVVGISGSPVFWVPTAGGTALWSPANIQLAGIQVSHLHVQELLRVQRIEPVRRLIDACLEEGGTIA